MPRPAAWQSSRGHAVSKLLAVGFHIRQIDVAHTGGAHLSLGEGSAAEAKSSGEGNSRNDGFETHFSQPL
jgi:hypothetical protein